MAQVLGSEGDSGRRRRRRALGAALAVVVVAVLLGRSPPAGVAAEAVRLMSDPVHTDLDANLAHYAEVCAAAERRNAAAADPMASVRGDPNRRAARLLQDRVNEQRVETEALPARVRALKAARAEMDAC